MVHEEQGASRAGKWLVAGYALASYLLFLASFGYFIFFSVGAVVPWTVDAAPFARVDGMAAVVVNLALVLLFAVQHTGMARRGFKRVLTRVLPEPAERATYVLASNLVLVALMLGWQPLPALLWDVDGAFATLLWVLNAAAWVLAVAATWMIDHLDLFGLKQAWLHLRGRERPPETFTMRFAYRVVRHPLQTGILLGLWVVPVMSVGHLVLALGMSAYIVVGLWFEERDLLRVFGERYRRYRTSVPMLLPRLFRRRRGLV